MLRALYSSAAGMDSQQLNLDIIANNLANVNTTGYKRTKIEFQDLLYQTTRPAGADVGSGVPGAGVNRTGANANAGIATAAVTMVTCHLRDSTECLLSTEGKERGGLRPRRELG